MTDTMIWNLIAQAEGGGEAPGGGGMMMFMLLMFGAMVVMMVFSSRGQKKRAAEREEALSKLKKNDVIWVNNSVKGIVHQIKDHEIVIKLDAKEGGRMTVRRDSVTHIGDWDAPDEKDASNKKEEK